jgi:hydroxyethylthiazole kinase
MVWQDIQRIRADAPLVHNITNYVVMNTTANALLAIGASPVMAHAIEEVEEMVGLARVANGHPMMARVTGMGCTSSALTGAFLAVNPSPFRAATHAMVVMGIAGEIAGGQAAGPGSFQIHFLDALHCIQESEIAKKLKIKGL